MVKYYCIALLIIIFNQKAQQQSWRSVGDSLYISSGANPVVRSFLEVDNALYVSGGFTHDNGLALNSFAKWDSTSWDTINKGAGSAIIAIEHFNGDIIVGGAFNSVEGLPDTRRLVRWTGTEWLPVGDIGYPNSTVECLKVFQNKLFVGGGFSQIGSTSMTGIACFDGQNWGSLGNTNHTVKTMTIYNNELVVGGYFTGLNGTYYGRIAAYDGTNWHGFGEGVSQRVVALTVDTINNFLYAGGSFYYADDTILSKFIARWDGSRWEAFPVTPNSDVYSLCFYRGELYMGGWWTELGGFPDSNSIARWDGSQWYSLGDNMSAGGGGFLPNVKAMKVYKDELYVGGHFTSIEGNTSMRGIARWYMPPADYNCNMLEPRVFCNTDTAYLEGGTATVQFYNNNAYSGSWQWDFGDGATDTVQNPAHTFTADTGAYNVCVTVEYEGCVKTACKTITVLNGTGLEEFAEAKSSFKLYPNPSTGTVTIETTLPEATTGKIVVLGLTGAIKTEFPLQTGENNISFETNGWAKGTYVVNLVVEGKVVGSEKLIV